MMALSLGLLALTLVIGKETYGAKNWIDLKFFSLQPSEFVKVALVVCLALDLSEKRTIGTLIPVGVFAVACVGLICLQKDLGAVLICFMIAVAAYFTATSNWLLCLGGFAAAAGGSVMMYKLFAHVRTRVAIWRNPWASPQDGGYQIVQSLIAIASGGMTGMGLGLGSAEKSVPVVESDFIFAALCEEFGIIIGLTIIALYVILFVRGLMLAMRARSSFHALLAVGVVTSLALQTFMIIGGVIKMVPLTGVTLPFISSGGSSMMSTWGLLAFLKAADERTYAAKRGGRRSAAAEEEDENPFIEEPVFDPRDKSVPAPKPKFSERSTRHMEVHIPEEELHPDTHRTTRKGGAKRK